MELIMDAQQMRSRLRQRLTRGELFGIALALGLAGLFLWFSPSIDYFGYDFKNYLNATHGDFSFYYYGYWLLPIFTVLAKLPFAVSYMLWCCVGVLGIFFSARVFGGKAPLALISFQMFYSLIYGQISGLVVGGLALCWWGLVNRKWWVAGLGIALASAKYQIGIPGVLFLLLTADCSWKDKFRALILPIFVWLASLLIYPGWINQALHTMLSNPPNDDGSISLWRWIGPWALLLWIPPVVLRLPPQQRLIALVATTGLALPYFQQADLLFLLTLPIGWIGLLGNLGYLLGFFGWAVLQALALLPAVVYIKTLYPAVRSMVSNRSEKAA
ncbi:MAG: glycosyltransferase family 87 protein [Anaerolineaceae bacterium]